MNAIIAKLLLFAGIVYLSLLPVAGQQNVFLSFRVISKAGLTMRDAPDKNGNKVAKIPYWVRIVEIADKNFSIYFLGVSDLAIISYLNKNS